MISVWLAKAGMAVPKKKTSKGKRNQRHAHWKAKAGVAAARALSIGKAVLSGRAQGFVYPVAEDEAEAEA
jgi:large subunit ribosomal protein L32